MSFRGWHTMKESRRDARCFYFGNKPGAPYVSFDWRGHNGWQSSKRIPGGYEFYTPTIYYGRLFNDAGGIVHPLGHDRRLLVPVKLAHFAHLRRKEYRDFLKPGGAVHAEPMPAEPSA